MSTNIAKYPGTVLSLETYIPVPLSQIVKSFWCLKVTGFTGSPYTEDILPDGHHEIIFHLSGDNAIRSNNSTGRIKEPGAFFAGQTLQSYSLELKNNSLLYGIRFYPHTVHFLFGFPAHIITNNMLPLHEIPKARMLANCISDDTAITFKNLEKALLQLEQEVTVSTNKFQYARHAVEEIIKNKGNTRIDRLIQQTGVSQRYFDTLFNESVGINPKAFCNIVQLNHFISYKNDHPHKSLTACCYEAGFFDQSHLVKLFRSVTGYSPKEYFKKPNHINNYFSVL